MQPAFRQKIKDAGRAAWPADAAACRRLLTRAYGLLLLAAYALACPGYASLTAWKTRFFFVSMGIYLFTLILAGFWKNPSSPASIFFRKLSMTSRGFASGRGKGARGDADFPPLPPCNPRTPLKRHKGSPPLDPAFDQGKDCRPDANHKNLAGMRRVSSKSQLPALMRRGLSIPQAALLLWLLLALISCLASPFGPDAWLGQGRGGGFIALCLYAALLFSAQAWAKPGKAELWAAAGAVLVMELIALLQLLGHNPFGLYPNNWHYYDYGLLYQGRFLSTLGNVGQLGAWFCLMVPGLLAAACLGRGQARWLLPLPAALAVPIMIAAEMEGALLGLGLSLLLLSPWLLTTDKRRRALLISLAALLLGLALLLLWHYAGPPRGSFYEAGQVLHGRAEDSFGSQRIGIWHAAWQLIQARPWLGFGPDCFAEAYAGLFQMKVMRVDAAHNEILNQAVCLGLPAAAAYAAALFATLFSLIRKSAQNRSLLIFAAGLLSYAIQDLFNFTTPIVAPAFWLIWGMSLAALRQTA